MVNITATSITIKSTPGLTFTYWTDQAATIPLSNPEAVPEGTYYIKGTTREQCFDVKPVNVRVLSVPHAQAGRDTTLEYVFFSALKAVPPSAGEAGFWTVLKGSGKIVDPRNPSTSVTGMSVGSNIFLWTVTNNVCPDASDTLKITVHDINMPTLLTPNNDGKNEYFILEGSMGHAKTEFSVFDRRGARVFFTPDYDNRWNGVDYNGKPLPDGTYFYVFRSHDGKSKSGFVVLRR
jgi:gliding motility-associated-like protein